MSHSRLQWIAVCAAIAGLMQPVGPAPRAAATQPAPHDEAAPHWDYGTEAGPARWGSLSPQYAACSSGSRQSPIDIASSTPAGSPALATQYPPASLRIVHHVHQSDVVNTGHSIQVDDPKADALTVGTDTFDLLQYHFHSPSEHTLNGKSFPLELHLVHRDAEGKLAVVGVLIQQGAHNAAFDPLIKHLPREKGAPRHYEDIQIDIDRLLPSDRAAFRYDGSLTTPPCSEGVSWFVMKSPVQLAADQIAAFRSLLHGNSRPVQPLNNRTILADSLTDH